MGKKLKIWVLAARPKTLMAGIAPVIIAVGLSLYYGVFDWGLSLICFLIAVLFQILSNYINDYYDYKKGSDDTGERLGPKRAVAEGWVTPKEMLIASIIVASIASILGLLLVYMVDWRLIFVGILIPIFAVGYSGGKYPLSYYGLGDVAVLLFYGIVPVVFTFFVQSHFFNTDAFVAGVAVGLVSINILVANNYRDYPTDKKANKRTTIVIFGKKFGEYFYLINGFLGVLLCQYFWCNEMMFSALVPLLYLILHVMTWREMRQISEGVALIPILGKTARNTIVFSLLLFVGLILDILR